jgi:putative FmdB family regulatory protein
MPTYEYQCDACGHEFELYQQITAPVKRKCPACGKPKLNRLIGTGAGVIFKGSGFYETDYRSDSYKKAAEADKKSAEPASDAKADSSPATTKPASDASSSPAAPDSATKQKKPQPKPKGKKK